MLLVFGLMRLSMAHFRLSEFWQESELERNCFPEPGKRDWKKLSSRGLANSEILVCLLEEDDMNTPFPPPHNPAVGTTELEACATQCNCCVQCSRIKPHSHWHVLRLHCVLLSLHSLISRRLFSFSDPWASKVWSSSTAFHLLRHLPCPSKLHWMLDHLSHCFRGSCLIKPY